MLNEDDGQQAVNDPEAEQELRRANDEWARALAQRDEAALDSVMADEFVLAYPFEGDDKGQFIEAVLTGELKVESLAAHGATVRVCGGAGIVFGTETANWHYRGRDLSGRYRFVRVYARKDNRWQIVALHLCSSAHH
jgi:ketosteroid isomerase-like protein